MGVLGITPVNQVETHFLAHLVNTVLYPHHLRPWGQSLETSLSCLLHLEAASGRIHFTPS